MTKELNNTQILKKVKQAKTLDEVYTLIYESKTKGPNRIDLKKGIFISNGTTYYIQPLEICYRRLVIFKRQQREILSGVKVEEAINLIAKMYLDRSQGRKEFATIEASYLDIMKTLEGFYDSIQGKHPGEVIQVNMDELMMFCTLFITVEGEDMTTYDPIKSEKKVEDWKTDMYYEDFFLLVQQRSKLYSEQLQNTFLKINKVK